MNPGSIKSTPASTTSLPLVAAHRTRPGLVARNLRAWFLCIACLAFAAGARGKDAEPLFQSETTLEVTLEAPWRQVLRKSRDPVRHPAVLSYTDSAGKLHRIEATVETRGLTRLRICRFPPLRLRFAPNAARGTVFERQRSLKMVTHCQNDLASAQYYVQELLAYRIYNALTEQSHRVRPLDIVYLDSAGGKPNGPRFAFLIEDLGDVGRRVGHKVAGEARFAPGDFEARALTRFMLFQYMIGNTDWDVLAGPDPKSCCHNVRVLGSEGQGSRIAVPYDFDSAGMVDASYAAPHPKLPIKTVTERLYRGFCAHNAALEPVRQEFLGHRSAILSLVRSESRLGPQRQRAVGTYLEAFYAVLGNETRFAREISGKCRK